LESNRFYCKKRRSSQRIKQLSKFFFIAPRVRGNSSLALPGIIGRKNGYLIPPCEIQRGEDILCPLEHNIVNLPFNCAREDPLLLSEPYRLTLLKLAVSPCVHNLPHYVLSRATSLKNLVLARRQTIRSGEKKIIILRD